MTAFSPGQLDRHLVEELDAIARLGHRVEPVVRVFQPEQGGLHAQAMYFLDELLRLADARSPRYVVPFGGQFVEVVDD